MDGVRIERDRELQEGKPSCWQRMRGRAERLGWGLYGLSAQLSSPAIVNRIRGHLAMLRWIWWDPRSRQVVPARQSISQPAAATDGLASASWPQPSSFRFPPTLALVVDPT